MNNKQAGAAVVRIGVALVYIWFGFSQLLHPSMWTSLVPSYAATIIPTSVLNIVLLNGVFELIFGLLLLVGFWTRIAAGLLALHAIHIVTVVGYSPIGVRDFGIMMAAIGTFLNGIDSWTLEYKMSGRLTQSPAGI